MKFYAIPSLAGLSKQGGLLSVFEGIEGIFKFLAVPGARCRGVRDDKCRSQGGTPKRIIQSS